MKVRGSKWLGISIVLRNIYYSYLSFWLQAKIEACKYWFKDNRAIFKMTWKLKFLDLYKNWLRYSGMYWYCRDEIIRYVSQAISETKMVEYSDFFKYEKTT